MTLAVVLAPILLFGVQDAMMEKPAQPLAGPVSESVSGSVSGLGAGLVLGGPADACERARARAAFDEMVEQYRNLRSYRDRVELEVVTVRDDSAPERLESSYCCIIDDAGELSVRTSEAAAIEQIGGQLGHLGGLGGISVFDGSPAVRAMQRRFNLWLAPHLAFRYEANPLERFRSISDAEMTPVRMSRVMVDDREMLKIELDAGDGSSRHTTARFDLYLDPEAMLIERIDGRQLMPDGATIETRLRILPERVEYPPLQG